MAVMLIFVKRWLVSLVIPSAEKNPERNNPMITMKLVKLSVRTHRRHSLAFVHRIRRHIAISTAPNTRARIEQRVVVGATF